MEPRVCWWCCPHVCAARLQGQERGGLSGPSSDVHRAREALTAARHRRDARALPKDEEDYFNEVSSWFPQPLRQLCSKMPVQSDSHQRTFFLPRNSCGSSPLFLTNHRIVLQNTFLSAQCHALNASDGRVSRCHACHTHVHDAMRCEPQDDDDEEDLPGPGPPPSHEADGAGPPRLHPAGGDRMNGFTLGQRRSTPSPERPSSFPLVDYDDDDEDEDADGAAPPVPVRCSSCCARRSKQCLCTHPFAAECAVQGTNELISTVPAMNGLELTAALSAVDVLLLVKLQRRPHRIEPDNACVRSRRQLQLTAAAALSERNDGSLTRRSPPASGRGARSTGPRVPARRDPVPGGRHGDDDGSLHTQPSAACLRVWLPPARDWSQRGVQQRSTYGPQRPVWWRRACSASRRWASVLRTCVSLAICCS